MQDPEEPDLPTSAWCLIGNVVADRPFGSGGVETRRGTKHFSPGTKVYCMGWPGTRDRFVVLGVHRGRRGGLVEMYLPVKHITNWRASLVRKPFVIRKLHEHGYVGGRPTWSKESATSTAAILTDRELRRSGAPQRFGTSYATQEIIPSWRIGAPVLYEVHDARNLDHRRTAHGLPPLRDQLRAAWERYLAHQRGEPPWSFPDLGVAISDSPPLT